MTGPGEPGPAEIVPSAAKEEPETLVLRGRPRPVVRFRRGLVIGLTAAASAALVGVTWLALEPVTFRSLPEENAGKPAEKGAAEVLAGAPAGYGDVPQLGAPLPGDLGRPILEHRKSLGMESGAAPLEPVRERDAADAARQARAAADEAARTSGVIVELARGDRPAPETEGATISAGSAAGERTAAAAPVEGRAFAAAGAGAVSPHGLADATSLWTLSAGTAISASLLTGLNSDLPGMVVAQVTEPVRDSATGRTTLVPQGARLIGRYDNVVAFGQQRALVAWQRIVFPDGASIALDNMPATDLAGYAGLEDRVDTHTWRLLKGIALSTLLGVGTELSLGSDESDLVRALRESSQENAARAGDQITRRNLEVQPTIRVRPGWPVRAIVHQDLVLRPWRG